MRRVVLLGLCGLALACQDQDCDPSVEDCGVTAGGDAYGGPVVLRSLHSGCSDRTRFFDIVFDGSVFAASVELAETDGEVVAWSERHKVPVFAEDPLGWWQNRYVELAVADLDGCEDDRAACADRYENGVSTLFSCTTEDSLRDSGAASEWAWSVSGVVRYRLDAAGGELRCVSFGPHADAVPDCTPWESP